MNESIIQLSAIIVFLSMVLLLWKILNTRSQAVKVLCIDVLSIQCLGLTILLALYGLGNVALQFGFALALLGFISTIILSNLIKS